MFGQIYQIYDKNTFKCLYVGSTKCLYDRKRQHKHHMLNKDSPCYNRLCYKEFRKIGFENLVFECVYESNDFESVKDLRKKEQQYYIQLKPIGSQVNAYCSAEYNKNRVLELNRLYYYKNRQRMMDRNKEEYICECGCKLTRITKYRHFHSEKHKRLMEQKNLSQQITALS